jgi:hypothetical protein
MALTQVQTAMLGTGAVLQVVTGTYASQVSTTSSTYVSTPLTVSITPKFSTSKILVMVTGAGGLNPSTGQVYFTIYRNSTNILTDANYLYGSASAVYSTVAMSTLDSPATTSSTTYTVYFRATVNTGYFCIGSTTNTITVMEIAG